MRRSVLVLVWTATLLGAVGTTVETFSSQPQPIIFWPAVCALVVGVAVLRSERHAWRPR